MKHFIKYLLLSILPLLFTSCHDVEEYANNPQGNFEALWTILDEHYCFFEYKGVDWQAVKTEYSAKNSPPMTSEELFRGLRAMLTTLQDGHTNLMSTFDVSRYWIWEQYPTNYDERLIREHYLNFDYRRVNGIDYQILKNNIGYMH